MTDLIPRTATFEVVRVPWNHNDSQLHHGYLTNYTMPSNRTPLRVEGHQPGTELPIILCTAG